MKWLRHIHNYCERRLSGIYFSGLGLKQQPYPEHTPAFARTQIFIIVFKEARTENVASARKYRQIVSRRSASELMTGWGKLRASERSDVCRDKYWNLLCNICWYCRRGYAWRGSLSTLPNNELKWKRIQQRDETIATKIPQFVLEKFGLEITKNQLDRVIVCHESFVAIR